MNITYEKNVYYSFIIFTLNNLAQFDDCFCSLNIATRSITSHLLSYRSSIKSSDVKFFRFYCLYLNSNEYDETSKAVEKLEEGPQTETTTSEINRLKQRQINQKIKIRVTGLKAEKVADDRDAILAKDCRGRLWKDHIPSADAIIFLIDSTDSIRFPKAKEAFDLLLNDKQILNKPLVIIGTKGDLSTGLDEEDLSDELNVISKTSNKATYGHLSNLKLYLSNMKDIASFGCAFRFIATFLKET
ncbi:unnamed protein product [Rotaria socialis]|uniref:small monomeric GTPase n=1 Tax=Rotaria socialis TaxID=392032 RepID=A0A817TED0_9BILA|nr:unnamed protein product [Rotaria socialis]